MFSEECAVHSLLGTLNSECFSNHLREELEFWVCLFVFKFQSIIACNLVKSKKKKRVQWDDSVDISSSHRSSLMTGVWVLRPCGRRRAPTPADCALTRTGVHCGTHTHTQNKLLEIMKLSQQWPESSCSVSFIVSASMSPTGEPRNRRLAVCAGPGWHLEKPCSKVFLCHKPDFQSAVNWAVSK